jgi:hypothetical protein
MKTALTITTALLALSLAMPAYAETPQSVPGTSIEGNAKEKNPGALTAPEANKSTQSPSGSSGMSDDSAANIPGTASEGERSEKDPSLSGSDNAADNPPAGSGESKGAAANIPGTAAEGDSSERDPGLSAPEKDKM